MKRRAWFAAALCAALAGLAWLWWLRPPAEPEVAPVPLGVPSQRTLVDANGNPQVWTLHKQELPREQLAAQALPAPEPAAQPAAGAGSAHALDLSALESWKHGDIKAALASFEAAAKADPDDARARSDYGRLLTLMGVYDQALPHLERAAQLEPDNPQVWVDLLSYYERAEQLERALYARQRAEALAHGRPLVRDPSGLWVLEGDSLQP